MNSLLEKYDKNKEKHLLDEVTAAAAVSGFTGKGGQLIDRLFAGGFHPEFGDIYSLLGKQIDDKIMKRLFSDEHTPDFERDWKEVDWKYEYDLVSQKDNSKFKSKSDTEMQLVDMEISYDKIEDRTEEMKKFVSDTNDWKIIYNKK